MTVSLEGLQDASTQAQGFTTDLKSVGQAASDAGTTAAPALDSMTAAGTRLQAALDRMAASDGPRGMVKNAALAQVALQQYEAECNAAGSVTEAMAARISAAGGQIAGTADKIGVLRKAQADLTAQSALAGSQLDALKTSGTSLTGMFDSMERTGTGVTKAIGALGLGVGIGAIAFVAAEAAGKKLGEALVALEGAYSAALEKQHASVDMSNLEKNALDAVAAGHIKLGATLAQTVQNYEIYAAISGKSTIATQAFIDALNKIQPPKNLQEATTELQTFAVALQAANAKGIESAGVFMAAEKKAIDTIAAGYATLGQVAPIEFQRVVTAQTQAVAAQKLLTEQGAQNAIEAYAKITAAKAAADAADVKSTQAAVTNAEQAMRALNAETVSAETYSARKKAIYELESAELAEAADKEALATAKQELDQAKLAASMGVSAFAFAQVGGAADQYTKDLAKGVQPSEALSDATERLQKSIQSTQEALPQLDSGLLKLALSGMKGAEQGAGDFAKQLSQMTDQAMNATKAVNFIATALDKLQAQFPITGTGIDTLIEKFAKLSETASTAEMTIGGD